MKIDKYLGIDWGEKRIGLALGEAEMNIATPFKTVPTLSNLLDVIEEEEITKIVLGNPLRMADSRLETSLQFNRFLELLKSKTKVEIELVDERLSSKQADSFVGNKKTKASRDEIAAMIILQNFLDRKGI